MERRSLVHFAIQDVVEFQASGFCGGVPHLLMDDIQMRLLGVMYCVLYARRHCPAPNDSPCFVPQCHTRPKSDLCRYCKSYAAFDCNIRCNSSLQCDLPFKQSVRMECDVRQH